MMKKALWLLLVVVVTIATDVVLVVGFDASSRVAAYICTGVAMAMIFGRQFVVTRRQIRERDRQFERVERVEWGE